jgi:DNA primase
MLSGKNKLTVINILDTALGVGSSLKGNEQAHHCPFCNHPKKKLQVNLDTQRWHCWVCDAKGRYLYSLLRRLRADVKDILKLKDIYGDDDYTYETKEIYEEQLKLPEGFKQLHFKPSNKFKPAYNKAIHYLNKRGITDADIVKYNIGYCSEGEYKNRIIIPSYDENGDLNYFVARSFYEDEKMKYKNPPISRNIIVFENMINWKEPIVLVEGVFDSFSVKRNVIPLLGKFLLTKLKNKIMEMGVKEVTIMLDSDAVEDSTKHTEWFQKNGIKVKNIIPTDKDAGEMGFQKVNELLKCAKETGWDELVLSKLNNI